MTTKTTILFAVLLLAACKPDDPSTYHNSMRLSGCEDAGLYTDAYFAKHGEDQTLEFKCGGKKQ
jgi:hypothetical protein